MTDHADTIRTKWPLTREQHYALVAERQQAQEERDAAFDAVGLPRTASLDDLIRHHRNNAGMAASGHKIAAEEWEKRAVKAEAERQQAQEEAEKWKRRATDYGGEWLRENIVLRDQRRQAIDALIDLEEWAFEEGHEKLAENIRGILEKLGEKPQ